MDLLALDADALDHLGALIENLTDPQLRAPTPCTGWTVSDLIHHMNIEHEAIAAPLLRDAAPPDAPVRIAFGQTAARWRAAFAQPGALDRPIHLPRYGVAFPGRQIIAIHLADMLVHHWDISRAIAVEPDLPDDLLRVAVPIAQALPADGPLRGPGQTYAAPVPVDANAPLADVLVAALGRSPDWRAPHSTGRAT